MAVLGAVVAGLALVLLSCPAAWPSAFNQPAGQGLAIVTGTFDAGDRSFDAKGKLIRTSPYTKREGSLYIEYGVTDWLQAVLRPDLVVTRLGGANGGRYAGLGASEIGAQVRLLMFGPAALAVQSTFRLPGTTAERNPALIGNTSRDVDARVLFGVLFPLGVWPSFLNAEAAYRMRSARAPDEAHIDVTLGTRPRPDILVLLQSFTTVPTAAGVPFFPRSTFSRAAFSLVYDIDPRWSVQVGVFTTVFGRDALKENGVQAAVWYRF